MSLFIRMTQSRAGAERLLEAQLLPILAQCDYLDTRPEADQAFIGRCPLACAIFITDAIADQGSFLPPAIQRYHQLLMPALQVVDGIIATLGTRHTTASQQVTIAFPTFFFVQLTLTAGAQLLVDARVDYRDLTEERGRKCDPAHARGGASHYRAVHEHPSVRAED